MDIEIRNFENTLIALVNVTPLPIEVKRLVLRDVLSMTETTANEVIMEQGKEKVKTDESREGE